ncbi:MAG: hypothetical protein LQ346_007224 [Caloplaca aetnensis]|nr:MAG: hypothetical protein LQ346_007224 [Caloplaca aetnensis]
MSSSTVEPGSEMVSSVYSDNSPSTLLINYYAWTTEPRVNLGIQMTMQGMNRLRATPRSCPWARASPSLRPLGAQTSDYRIVVPGKNMVTAFINRSLNSEDACSVSKEFADSDAFAWSGYIDYPLPSGCGAVGCGTVLESETWWKPAMKGLVTRVFMNKNGGLNATVQIYCKELKIGDKIGDKLATWHGIKFTVGELIPYKDMPVLIDATTGERFKPNMLVSTKNLNRGLGG